MFRKERGLQVFAMNLPKKRLTFDWTIDQDEEYILDHYPYKPAKDIPNSEWILDSSAQKQLADYLQEAEDELKVIRSIYENIYDPEEGLTDEAEELLNMRIEKIDVIHENVIKFLRGE
jgi:hypothetical protein